MGELSGQRAHEISGQQPSGCQPIFLAHYATAGDRLSGRERWSEYLVFTDISNIKTDKLTIRLKATTGFYEINNVFLDYSEDEPMKINKLELLSAIKNNETNVKDLITEEDEKYLELTDLTEDIVDLEFKDSSITSGWGKDYFVKVRGYYHFREFTEHQSFFHFLKTVKDIILPVLYEEGFEARYFMKEYVESLFPELIEVSE